jgi:hypothetical protein
VIAEQRMLELAVLTAAASLAHCRMMNELPVDGLHALGVGDDRIYVDHGLTGTNLGQARAAAGPGPPAAPATHPWSSPSWTLATASHVRSTIDEYIQVGSSMDQAASLGDFADKPLVVPTAGSGSDAARSPAQNDIVTLSTNSVHRVIDRTTHMSLIVDEDAAGTTQAILDVVSSVRSVRPLVR